MVTMRRVKQEAIQKFIYGLIRIELHEMTITRSDVKLKTVTCSPESFPNF